MIKRTLYFGNPYYLSLKNEQLVIKLPEVEKNESLPEHFKKESLTTIPIEDIGVIVLDHKQITITQALLEKLLEHNVAVASCNASHLPVGLFLPLCGNSVQTERFRNQINASQPLLKQLWQQTVMAKIENQVSLLNYSTEDTHKNMSIWASNVKSGDIENLEARAAVYYWKNLFPDMPHFLRGREEEAPNNLLNYGYAILRAVVARALVCSGLLPTFGIHHRNKYNAYCLADDIMEPYRPMVDKMVLQIVKSGVDYSELTKEIKAKLLSIPVQDVRINGKCSPLMVAVSVTTSSLQKCFAGGSRKIAYPTLRPLQNGLK